MMMMMMMMMPRIMAEIGIHKPLDGFISQFLRKHSICSSVVLDDLRPRTILLFQGLHRDGPDRLRHDIGRLLHRAFGIVLPLLEIISAACVMMQILLP